MKISINHQNFVQAYYFLLTEFRHLTELWHVRLNPLINPRLVGERIQKILLKYSSYPILSLCINDIHGILGKTYDVSPYDSQQSHSSMNSGVKLDLCVLFVQNADVHFYKKSTKNSIIRT